MTAPKNIVLVHGFWVTPRSWEHWIARFEAKGFNVIAPGYPGFEVEVEALRADPTPIVDLRVPDIIARYEEAIDALDAPPIIMGHSAGGAFSQILLDHGRGVAGVVFNSAPTEGVPVAPFSQIRSTWPILKSPANHHKAIGFDVDQWEYAFTNGCPREFTEFTHARYAIPASGRILWDSVTANLLPGHQDTWVDYRNPDRAPLLFVSGTRDHIMPPAVQRSNAKHYRGEGTITERIEFDGPHLMIAADGWEEIADAGLEWALEHARQPTVV